MMDYREQLENVFHGQISQLGTEKLLSKLEWESLPKDIVNQTSGKWSDLTSKLLNNNSDAFIFPLQIVPFERDARLQIAAVSKRLSTNYHLKNNSSTKNLAFLGEDDTISFVDPLVKKYIQDINEKVGLKQVETDDLAEQDIAIHRGNAWSIDALQSLSEEEFVPRSASGLYVLICRKTDTDLRQKLAIVHHVESTELSNIERGLQLHFVKRQDRKLLAVHVRKDSLANYHAHAVTENLAGSSTSRLEYHQFSQSTTYQFLQEWIKLIES